MLFDFAMEKNKTVYGYAAIKLYTFVFMEKLCYNKYVQSACIKCMHV